METYLKSCIPVEGEHQKAGIPAVTSSKVTVGELQL